MSGQAAICEPTAETESPTPAEPSRLLNIGDLMRAAEQHRCPYIIDSLTGHPCIRLIAPKTDVFARTLRNVEHLNFEKGQFTPESEDWGVRLLIGYMKQGFVDISPEKGA